jgi:ribosomal-protein-serine acetyltransferase
MAEALQPPEHLEINAGINGVVLRQLTVDDAERYFELIDFDRTHFTSVDEDTANKYLTVDDVRKRLYGDEEKVRLGIWADGVMVGSANYRPFSVGKSKVEIGYWIGKQYSGHGYAADAVRTLTPYLFSQGWPEVEAWAREKNKASQKTLRKAGFTERPDRIGDFVKFVLETPHP